MAYDTSKLTKLAALKSMGEEIEQRFAKKSSLEEIQNKVEGIVSAGGEPNVLEGFKVNGVALNIVEKMVDLLIATGTENGTIKVNNVDVAVAGLMALAFKAKVTQDDLDSALAKVISDKAESSALSTVSSKVNTLIGAVEGDDAKTVREISAEEVAKIVAGAPESFDTLKEIADWLASHETDAASMNSSITANKSDISKIKTLIGTIPEEAVSTDIVSYIAECITAIGIGDYVKTEQMTTALNQKVDKQDGKGLSTNDFTTELKNKLDGIHENSTCVEESATPGKIMINGEEKTVVEIATDQEVNEMIREVFPAATDT